MSIDKLGYDFENLLKQYNEAFKLVCTLKEQGELLLFGGAVREYMDNEFHDLPRDFDIVIKKNNNSVNLDEVLDKFEYKKNRFDGYKIKVDSLEFDVWEIEKTWAFKENKIQINSQDYDKKLQDTVFLNIDSIVYNLSTKDYYNKKYESAMKNKKLDIVLEENPYIELNLLRAILFKKKYNMNFSDKLRFILAEFVHNNNNYLKLMKDIQLKHYNSLKINCSDLDKEIKSIIY
ncbi:Uncharacterised protein [[Clostridium] sordellii]|uniref:hypothetical protein n=1 Tax=Paraclostridium sordellii TaxID=1505 RepID=UPI0005E4E7FE|nr:hypothetical protein [Paeniclostridium sordellii]MBX9182240.1 hypothetical protein [Paeniclostridium sordellii]CEO15716.1 Uncharacterised protein [[Clostridium] sordellii] [Paeniclostridium sordellii]